MVDGASETPGLWATLSRLWQLPVLGVSLVMLFTGWFLAAPEGSTESIYPQMLDNAKALLTAGRYDEALAELHAVAADLDKLPKPLAARYNLLRADTLALRDATREQISTNVHEVVVGLYEQAMLLEAELDKPRLVRYADSLVALGRIEKARQLLPKLGAAGSAARRRLWRKMIESPTTIAKATPKQRLDLIEDYRTELGMTRAENIWATARQAEIVLEHQGPEQATTLLHRRLIALDAADPDKAGDLGELFVLMGKAYLALASDERAERWFRRALEVLPAQASLNGEALVGLGRIRLGESDVTTALEHFDDAVNNYPMTRSHLQALVGRAESRSRLGSVAEALEDYGKAVKLATTARRPRLEDVELLTESLEAQRDWRFAQGDYETSLRLLELERQLFGPNTPPAIIARLAATHEQIALDTLGAEDVTADLTPLWLRVTPELRNKISTHFGWAGQLYLDHAEAVTVADDEAYGESLWRAGDCYDKAGEHPIAIGLFKRFITERPNDPRKLLVLHRLGQALQADGQLDAAIMRYEQLINDHPKTPEAYMSLVPLARCYINKGPDFRNKAQHILQTVVNDHPGIRPESNEYRRALIELGTLFYSRGEEGDYERAIEALSAAVERYGSQENLPDMLFRLGDAYRKSVDEIDRKLTQPLPPSQKVEFRAERARRLDKAREAFDRVIGLYEARDPATLGSLQKLFLRNAYFYRADCAYDLGRYDGPDGAIALYEQTVKRYEHDPSVLVALVQIVNCWCELGNYDEARSVNNRAKWFLKRIPDEQLNDPDLPMSREHWQRWLEWMSQLNAKAEDTATAEVAP